MVDTGNSYEGLCEYFGGKYIAYTEEKPISMNPFKITKDEYNIEKKDFLRNLILLIWKGQDHADSITEIEKTMLDKVIEEYYSNYFSGENTYTPMRESQVRKKLERSLSSKNVNKSHEAIMKEVDETIERLAKKRDNLKVNKLSFNTFFDFATVDIEIVCTENGIDTINYNEFSTMLATSGTVPVVRTTTFPTSGTPVVVPILLIPASLQVKCVISDIVDVQSSGLALRDYEYSRLFYWGSRLPDQPTALLSCLRYRVHQG